MKTANDDHKLLRNITRDTITNDLELNDFGLQLDLPPSMVKQKLRDYPRSIETASYMVASEWWDSSGNPREEKYRLLLDTVRSMGKKSTAQRLENVVQENNMCLRNSNSILDRISSSQGGTQHPLTNSANNEIDNNNNTAFSSSAGIADLHSNRSNLAICDAVTDPVGNSGNLEGNAGDLNIVEITEEEHGNQEQIGRRNSCEIQYSFPPSVEHEAVDIFEGSPASVNSHESEMTGRTIDTTHLYSSVNGQPPFASNSHETEMKASISQLKGSASAKWTSSSVKCDEKKLNICERSDVYVPMSETISHSAASREDLDVFDHVGTETENTESARLSKLSRKVGLNDFGDPVRSLKNSEQFTVNSDVWFDESQSEDRMLRNDEESSEKGNFRKGRNKPGHEGNFERLGSDDEDEGLDVSVPVRSPLLGKTRPPSHTFYMEDPEVVDQLLPQVHISNAQSQDVMFQKPSDNMTVHSQTGLENRQTVKMNGQTGTVNGRTGKLNCQTCVDMGRTGAANSLRDRRNNGVVNGEIGEVVDQQGVANSQTCVQNGQRGTENSQTCKSSPPSQKINTEDPEVVYHLLPEVHILNTQSHDVMFQKPSVNVTVGGQAGVENGQTGVMNDHTGVVNGQTGVVNGQTGAVNGQTDVVKDQTGVDNRQTCIVGDQIGVVDDETGVCVQNGQRGAESRQTGVVNGKVIKQKNDESKKRSSGFLQRIYRRLFRRKKTVAADEADAELAVPLAEVKTTDS